ncbi:MAG: ATP-binding cassette domain-containing protein, partial [Clostridia bacterium]|nr:ATP-binding cassette domain-containing protein [Clostridia bacterium]
VRDNICIGRPDATMEEIVEAAKLARAHGFIEKLEKGYDTPVSDDLAGLSYGQKQLICIARLMLTSPPMLILDEATSSIDTRTEIKIQQGFLKLMRGRTSFIVAHRLSTIKRCDVIVVMKDGKIIEKGTHEELLSRDGFYRELYLSQNN